MTATDVNTEENVLNAGAAEATGSPALRKSDLNKSFWRFFWSFEVSWNYERMQALGFAYAMEPILRRLHPRRRTTQPACSATSCSSTPAPWSAPR